MGGVWSKEKVYPDLYAQIAHPLFEYSSYPMPAEGLSPDGFISGKLFPVHQQLYTVIFTAIQVILFTNT